MEITNPLLSDSSKGRASELCSAWMHPRICLSSRVRIRTPHRSSMNTPTSSSSLTGNAYTSMAEAFYSSGFQSNALTSRQTFDTPSRDACSRDIIRSRISTRDGGVEPNPEHGVSVHRQSAHTNYTNQCISVSRPLSMRHIQEHARREHRACIYARTREHLVKRQTCSTRTVSARQTQTIIQGY